MQVVVYLPLVLAVAFARLGPRTVRGLPPVLATWLLSAGSVVIAGGVLGSLALLASTLVAQAPPAARRGHWTDSVLRHADPVLTPVAVAALVLLVLAVVSLARAAFTRAAALRTAFGLAAALPAAGGELVVVDDDGHRTFAVPGRPGRPGRIVVSAPLLRRLDAGERRALLTHERAHLTGRHHLHQAAVHLAAAACPPLRPVRAELALACERWADEAAARAVPRDVVGAALVGAASAPGPSPVPGVALGAATTDLGVRLAALRTSAPRPVAWRVVLVVGLVTATAAALLEAAHDTERLFEFAQAAYRLAAHR